MEHPPTTPPLPSDYYRRHAARVRKLASEATTLAVKEHLREVALEYEQLETGSIGAPRTAGHRSTGSMPAPKFAIGQTVRFSPDRLQLSSARGDFRIVRLLPEEPSGFQYRVKSKVDGHERVVREDQLTHT